MIRLKCAAWKKAKERSVSSTEIAHVFNDVLRRPRAKKKIAYSRAGTGCYNHSILTQGGMVSIGRLFERSTLFGLTMILSTWCAAETYYVSSQGRDSAPGTSSAAAFKSLEKAFGTLNNGDALYLMRGNIWRPSKSLAIKAANVTIGAYGGGARPVIDGQKKVPSLGSHNGLIHVTGDNAKISDVILINSGGTGIRFFQVKGALAENVKVDWTYRFSLQSVRSSNVIFRNCESVHSAAQYIDPNRPNGGWPHALSIQSTTDAIVEGCIVHEGWGEGIDAYWGSQNVVIRDNLVYAMRAVGIYVDTSRDIDILRNIVLGTTDRTYHRHRNYVGAGIYLANEPIAQKWPVTQRVRIYNNLVAYTQQGIAFGGEGNPDTNFKGIRLAHNTFVDNKHQFDAFTQKFSGNENIFANNIFLSIDAASSDVGSNLTLSSIAWHNNYWSKAPHAAMRSPGDVYGGAKLTKMIGWTSIKPTPDVSAADFKPRADSTTGGAARKISGLNVSEDFNGAPRDSAGDLGALNYSSSNYPSSQKIAKPSAPNLLTVE